MGCIWNKQKKIPIVTKAPIVTVWVSAYKRRISSIAIWLKNLLCFNIKVNKSVYTASRTYQFCWQYAIILVWKMWSGVK